MTLQLFAPSNAECMNMLKVFPWKRIKWHLKDMSVITLNCKQSNANDGIESKTHLFAIIRHTWLFGLPSRFIHIQPTIQYYDFSGILSPFWIRWKYASYVSDKIYYLDVDESFIVSYFESTSVKISNLNFAVGRFLHAFCIYILLLFQSNACAFFLSKLKHIGIGATTPTLHGLAKPKIPINTISLHNEQIIKWLP